MWCVTAAGILADADAAIFGRRAEPHRALFLALVQHLPVAHMVAAIGAGADRLFEGEVLAAAEIIEIADRRVLVGAIEQHAADDLDRRFQRDRIGRIPAGRVHRADHVALVADQADIHGIAGNALRGARHHRQIGEAFLVLVMRPERGQHEIGEQARRPRRRRARAAASAPAANARRRRDSIVVEVARTLQVNASRSVGEFDLETPSRLKLHASEREVAN